MPDPVPDTVLGPGVRTVNKTKFPLLNSFVSCSSFFKKGYNHTCMYWMDSVRITEKFL